MSFIKKFKSFLEMININYDEYADCIITDRNGNEYLFSQMNEERLKTFDWAYFLARQNQIILLNNNQDTMDSINAINAFQDGRIAVQSGFFDTDIKELDSTRLEYAKDIYYLIKYVLGGVNVEDMQLMYIEDGSCDNFLICMAALRGKNGFVEKRAKKVIKAAQNLGIYLFPLTIVFPKRQIRPAWCKDCEVNGITVQKNHYNKDRNATLIDELKAKQREKRASQLNFVMSQEDDAKITQKAKKLYDEVKIYGLESLSRENPQLVIESFLIDVFKVLLYKKWASYKAIVELEVNDGYFFHMYEDGFETPSKQDLIFNIIDLINETH